ncbi:uncharacterized protein M421DRAFT_61905 [Didymella exigua CBS 183.55]|uniref:Prion-inhibition and propagation HeLo domain-containing protein n=1 Tax=Didymella exigua CBS 183.55 TaxID=1150837 RepID=A0A6A5RPZ5_9PLEO|nr:uncharacterized protein M421DRAFT_61905 [Didymella exigua CBS 183.55]KAF1929124.1 hypothetical protein M421DRAFT_61905 [Didymella exigua CBS 183.55]
MAEVIGIISGLLTLCQTLETFAGQIHRWRRLSDRLFDLREGVDAAEISLQTWQKKYDVQARRPIIYLQVLFGKMGCERIQSTLGGIKIISKTMQRDVDLIIGRALSARPGRAPLDGRIDEFLVRDCLQRIQRNTSWSRKFVLSVLGRADDLEMRLERLHRKMTMLERFSDYYLEKEHPDIFSEIKRLPGRRIVLRVSNGRVSSVQNKLLDAFSAQKDAEMLHKASGQGDKIHIGLSVPQIRERDFAFLISLNGQSQEVLVHPVKIKAVNGSTRVQSDLAAAVPSLMQRQNNNHKCYIQPSSRSSDGFELTLPQRNLLSDLEWKDPLSALFKNQHTQLSSQILYPQDQSSIASGIAQSSFRLIGSPWLTSLDCNNIRWRRTADNRWVSMLTATPSNASTTRSLDACLASNKIRRDARDLSKHIHIFRTGLVIAELCLKSSISYVKFDASTDTIKLFGSDGEELDATEIAAEVERKTNVFLGNMVFFCLSALQDRDRLSDKMIEESYFTDVVREAKKLDGVIKAGRTWADRKAEGSSAGASPRGSGFATPRSSRY